MKYNEITRRYFERAPHAGILDGPGAVRGAAGASARGLWVQFELRSDGSVIGEVRFLCFGCPHSIAVAAYVAERAPGGTLVAALPCSVKALQSLFEVPEEKLGRLLIIEDAWLAAVRDAIDSRA
jgi:NifU-like protein involved in Fe-S cluster formation